MLKVNELTLIRRPYTGLVLGLIECLNRKLVVA